jgi:ribose 1,5-bisphosphokinase
MPGRLALIVGPSGAGKDTLIRLAQHRLAGRGDVVFPRRVITRAPDTTEDHVAVDEAAFARMDFALSWHAHGLAYGIPREIEPALAADKTVIVNVSRRIVPEARRRYACLVIAVTAPPEILAARLAQRGREDEADIGRRLQRETPDVGADVQIVNDGTPEAGAAALLTALGLCAMGNGETTGAAFEKSRLI